MNPLPNAYQIIKDHYGATCSERSGVEYMNHIDEGLVILDAIDSHQRTKAAFCLHPIVQVPSSLKHAFDNRHIDKWDVPNAVMLLAMEYRNKANAYVCRVRTDDYELADLPKMILHEVSEMLIADKIQNYKDFLLYHQDHKRAAQLDKYFNLWFEHLGLSNNERDRLLRRIQ